MCAEQSERLIECLQPGQAGGAAQVEIEPGGREPAVHRHWNRRTHRQPHRLQQQRRDGRRCPPVDCRTSPAPGRARMACLHREGLSSAKPAPLHPKSRAGRPALRGVMEMPVEGAGGLHPGAQAAAHFLQSGQHRRRGNAVDLQREVSLGQGLRLPVSSR